MKLAKIVKISISFNQLVFPANLTDSQPLDIQLQKYLNHFRPIHSFIKFNTEALKGEQN